MKKEQKEAIQKLREWIADTNQVRAKKLALARPYIDYDEFNDVEFVVVETESDAVLYGQIELLETYSGLHFYGTRIVRGKLQIMLSLQQLT